MTLRRASYIGLGAVAVLLLALAGLWLARARLAAQFAQSYFRQHGVAASVDVGTLGLSGASGRFALGPADAPEVAADSIELFFDPLRWKPYLVEVRLKNPVVRARLGADGKVTLPTLQRWLDSLAQGKEKSPYVSDDLAVSFTGLRALLATPGGALEVDGDAKLVKMKPVSAVLTVKPGALRYQDITARVQSGALTLAGAGDGYRLSLHFSGDVARDDMAATKLDVTAETPLLRLGKAVTAEALQVKASVAALRGAGVTAAMAQLTLEAKEFRLNGGTIAIGDLKMNVAAQKLNGAGVTANGTELTLAAQTLRFANGVLTLGSGTAQARTASLEGVAGARTAKLDLGLRNVTASAQGIEGDGDVALEGAAALPDTLRKKIQGLPVLAMEPPLQKAVTDNLGPFAVTAKAKMARHGGATILSLTAPLTARTTKGGLLRISALNAVQRNGAVTGRLDASLSGGGLPAVSLAAKSFAWDGQRLRADVGLAGKLDFSVFKGIDTALDGALVAGNGAVSFTLARCEPLALAAMASLATKISAQLCPTPAPLFAVDSAGWRAVADAKDAAAFLPLATAQLSGGVAHLAFDGARGLGGAVTVTAGKIADGATPLRFQPVTGSGSIALAGDIWRGRFAVADGKARPLGTVTLTHAMASGQGGAHIEAALTFAQSGLQPADLSPLLAPLKKADGRADFTGDIAWSPAGLGANTGTLATKGFGFLTPMGRAHGLDTTLALTSLLPPATADAQELSIAGIDWTLPFSALGLRFGFNTQALKIERLETNVAEGHVALSPFTVMLAAPQVQGRATITSLSLAPLLTASNLSGKGSMEGKLSGVIPFTFGMDGFRIQDGHLTADGPGRLSLTRALWGDNAVAANAVQDFAYQALENLAFDSLKADINSIDKGRLQIVFHIKGRSDPPTPQTAEVRVSDILNGTALYKPIPLPSSTPIELTLDTSLNFDELLKSYAEAWSKALNGGDSR